MSRVIRFLQKEKGVSSIEYALIAALIAIAIVASVSLLGTSVSNNYENIESEVTGALN